MRSIFKYFRETRSLRKASRMIAPHQSPFDSPVLYLWNPGPIIDWKFVFDMFFSPRINGRVSPKMGAAFFSSHCWYCFEMRLLRWSIRFPRSSILIKIDICNHVSIPTDGHGRVCRWLPDKLMCSICTYFVPNNPSVTCEPFMHIGQDSRSCQKSPLSTPFPSTPRSTRKYGIMVDNFRFHIRIPQQWPIEICGWDAVN